MATSSKLFLVTTSAPTFKVDNEYCAYAPYVKEADIWFSQVKDVTIFSPDSYPTNVFLKAYKRKDLKFEALPFLNFSEAKDSFISFLKLPKIFFRLYFSFWQADHLHLRCPGNVGLVASFVQILFPWKHKSAKYAGNWDPRAKQPWTYRLQKWILSNTFLTRNMQVLVYGEWSNQSKNIVPFFTASFSEDEKTGVRKKAFSGPFTFLFVGNLVEGKQPLEVVKLVEVINAAAAQETGSEIRCCLEIYGDGPERKKLETYVRENQLEQLIIFKGSRPLEELKNAYKKAHFVILPSKSEGWPKAIAEGMFFGCIPIATPVSCVPWMLGGGSRGILLTEQANGQQLLANGSKEWSGVREQDVLKIRQLLADQEEMKRMSEEAKNWSQQYTLERFEEAIKEVLNNKK